jgi:hypothetical protein
VEDRIQTTAAHVCKNTPKADPSKEGSNVCLLITNTTSMGDLPLERTADKRKVGIQQFFAWWVRRRLLSQVHKALQSTAAFPPPPRSILEGAGVVVLPSDPVEAALSALVVRDLCRGLAFPVRLAGSPSCLRWIPECGAGVPIQTPDAKSSPRAFAEWLEYNRAHRADWSLLASTLATPVEEAAFFWLGQGARIAVPHSCPGGSANIIPMAEQNLTEIDAHLRKLLSVIRPQIAQLDNPSHARGGPVVIEVPDDLPEKGGATRKWATAITRIATTTPILLAHYDPLPNSISDLLRGLGPRVAITHLSNADDTLALASHAKIWIGPRSPTTALATLARCPVMLIGSQKSSAGYPEIPSLTISSKIIWQGSTEGV